MENEIRLIDAKAGKKAFLAIAQPAEYKGVIHMVVPISEIDKLPTVDAAEVVRCRDCKFYKKFQSSLLGEVMCCIAQGGMRVYKGAEDFCSLGERKQMTEHMEVRTNE